MRTLAALTITTAALFAPLATAGTADEPGAALAPITLCRAAADPTPPGSPEMQPARGWPQAVREVVATPIFADLDRDGSHEIIVLDDYYAYVFSADGALWSGWPVVTRGSQQHAAVADIDGDQIDEIIFGSNLPTALLRVYDQHGQPKPGWPVSIPFSTLTNLTCPVVVDLDGDGALEIGIAGELGVFFYRADGTPQPGWPYTWSVPVNNPQWSAPAVGDIDRDGSLEVVVGDDNYPSYRAHAIRADGTSMPGWPIAVRPVYSSPALADLDGDLDLEIIMQEGDPGSQGYRLWVWHHTGEPMAGWPRNVAVEGHSSRCGPAVADVDADGRLEIVTATSDGRLHVFLVDGTEYPGFPIATGAPDYSIIASPSVIDMDADGPQEIFLTYWRAQHQYLSAWRLDGTVLSGFPKEIHANSDLNAHASQHLLDREGDGDLDLVTAGSGMSAGLVWVLEVDNSVFDPAGSAADWPKPRHDLINTGCYPVGDPAGVAEDAWGAARELRLAPTVLRRGDGLVLQLPEDRSGILEVWDPSGRCVTRCPLAAGDRTILPARGVFDRRAGNGVFLMRWTPVGGAPAPAARVVVLGD